MFVVFVPCLFQVIAEGMSHFHDAQEAFDNTWRDLCVQSADRCHKAWVGSAAARLALGGVDLDAITPPSSLQDVPMSSDLIVNPFSRWEPDRQTDFDFTRFNAS